MSFVIRTAAIAILLAGCDIAFGLAELPTADLAPGCSGTRLLSRGFGDGTLDPMWTPSPGAGATIQVGSNTLEITTTQFSSTSVSTVGGLDVRGDAVSIGVVPGDFSASQLGLELYSAVGPNALYQYVLGQTLYFGFNDDTGASNDLATLRYDPEAHRYWRISQVGHETRWETSSDDTTWTLRALTSNLDWVSYVRPSIILTAPANVDFTIDALDAGAPAGAVCRAAVLADDFSTSMLRNKWGANTNVGAALELGGGQVVATVDGSASEVSEVYSSTLYNLNDGSFAIHVAEIPDTASDGTVAFAFANLAGETIVMAEAAGMVHALISGQGAFGSTPWDPSMTSWWRLRGAGGVLYWEVSGDGRTYHEIAEAPGLALDRVGVYFYLSSTQANSATFEDFNVLPR